MENTMVINNESLGLMMVQAGNAIQQQNKENEDLRSKVAKMSEEYGRLILKVSDLKECVESVKSENTELVKKIEEVKEKTSQITDTLMSDGTAKRKLENKIHSLVYNHVPKGTLRSELFHGNLTASCKKHINKSLNITKFDYVMKSDIGIAENLATKFMTKFNVHTIMRQSAKRLFEQSQKSKKDNEKRLGTGNGRKYELLDQLLEEVGGDINAI